MQSKLNTKLDKQTTKSITDDYTLLEFIIYTSKLLVETKFKKLLHLLPYLALIYTLHYLHSSTKLAVFTYLYLFLIVKISLNLTKLILTGKPYLAITSYILGETIIEHENSMKDLSLIPRYQLKVGVLNWMNISRDLKTGEKELEIYGSYAYRESISKLLADYRNSSNNQPDYYI